MLRLAVRAARHLTRRAAGNGTPRNENSLVTHKIPHSVSQAETYSVGFGFLTIGGFVSLLLAKPFRIRVQLREQRFQPVDIDVQYPFEELAADFFKPHP
jgi:hypothetical protein